ITGALALIVLAGRVQPARLFVLSVAALGVAFVVYARTTSLVPAALVLLLAGGTQAGLSGAMSPLVLHTTPRELVGRVASIFGPLVSLASIVSAGAAGILASTVLHGFHARFGGLQLGPIDLIFTASGLLLLAGSIYAAFNLWGVRLELE